MINMMKMSITYFTNLIGASKEMKTFKKIMMIITKTKTADLKIIMYLKNQKTTMIFNQTNFTKATINSNHLS
jgi:hypothetical protein